MAAMETVGAAVGATVEATMETAMPSTVEATMSPTVGSATETTAAAAWTCTETCRRRAHACNCGNHRNENLVELHVFTSFFWVYTGVGDLPTAV
jgi:hypothetical protein